MDFVTHVPAPELKKCPAFVRTPSALERNKNGLPSLPGERSVSHSILQRSQELDPVIESEQSCSAKKSVNNSINTSTTGKYCFLDATSPYRKSNEFKSEMSLPVAGQRTGKNFYAEVDGSVNEDKDDDFNIDGQTDNPEVNTCNDRSAQQQTDRVLCTASPSPKRKAKIDFCERYGVSPSRVRKTITKSNICDFDENKYQSIPFSGSIRVDRYMKENGLKPLTRDQEVRSIPIAMQNDLCDAEMFE